MIRSVVMIKLVTKDKYLVKSVFYVEYQALYTV